MTKSADRGRSGTHFALYRVGIATCFTFALLAGGSLCGAGELSVTVFDKAGAAIGEVVITAAPVGSAAAPIAPQPAIMDQRNKAFVPGVLVVATGTRVEFPNNDSVSHQVYSFSAAKRFQLPLYKGALHAPVTFDRPGLVVLGCNIHDAMVGYIYVTEAPFFGTTDNHGTITLKDLPAGDYHVSIWSPYIVDAPASLERTVHVGGSEPSTLPLQLALPLRARPEPRPRRRDWDY
jgi:plastocyanin